MLTTQDIAELQFEYDCLPRPGEVVVNMVDNGRRLVSVSGRLGSSVVKEESFDNFSHRYCGPWVMPTGYYVGEIVVRIR